jgi:sugar porter (SP) family MFS transporter
MNRVLLTCTIAAALGGLLYGYDTVIINGAMLNLVHYFQLSPVVQGWTVSSALVGCLIGAIVVGKPGDYFGSHRLLKILAVLFFASSVGCGLAPNIELFIIFRFLGGLAIGGASVLCPVYISEISPPKHRGLLASTFQLAIVSGILLSLITNYLILNMGDNNWRWMLFSGAFPAVAFFFMLLIIRKSPRWLVKKGLTEEARRNIEDLSSHEIDTEETLREIQESINLEKNASSIKLFHKPFRRIVIIGIFVGIVSQLTGIGVVFYYSAQIFSIAGFSADTSMLQSVILGVTNLVFTIIAMMVIDRVGRKRLLLIGQSGMVIVLGLFGYGLLTHSITGYWLVVLLVAYIACFASSMGVVVWVMLSEMFPNIIRARGASLGSFSNWATSAFLNFFFPLAVGYFGSTMSEQQKGMSYAFLFLSVMTLLGFFFLKRYLTETKGKTLEQIEKEVLC